MTEAHASAHLAAGATAGRSSQPADVRLTRFNPLQRVFFLDDFDQGFHGWGELIGNHDGDLDKVRPIMSDMRPAQRSTVSFTDIGTHGPLTGTYALKLATRAKRNHMAQLIKRATLARLGKVQVEAYFAFTAEQAPIGSEGRQWDGNYHPSEADFGDFSISNDVCIGDGPGDRAHCVLRYVNTNEQGDLVRKWFYKTSVQPTTKMVRSGIATDSGDYHVTNVHDWEEVPGGEIAMCTNELPSKVNWHYIRWVFDTAKLANVELQVNTTTLDLTSVPVPRYEHAYEGLTNLLNFCFDVRTHRDVRNFLYLDSELVTADW